MLFQATKEFHKKGGKEIEKEIGSVGDKEVRKGKEDLQVKEVSMDRKEQNERSRTRKGVGEQDIEEEGVVNTKGKGQRARRRGVEEIGGEKSKEGLGYDQVWMDCDTNKGTEQLISVEVREVILNVKNKWEVKNEEHSASSNPREKGKERNCRS